MYVNRVIIHNALFVKIAAERFITQKNIGMKKINSSYVGIVMKKYMEVIKLWLEALKQKALL